MTLCLHNSFCSTTALRFADLEGLPSNNTMGPVNARPLQDVRLNHDEGSREERPGRFLTTRTPIGRRCFCIFVLVLSSFLIHSLKKLVFCKKFTRLNSLC